jgi:hypothetical protein
MVDRAGCAGVGAAGARGGIGVRRGIRMMDVLGGGMIDGALLLMRGTRMIDPAGAVVDWAGDGTRAFEDGGGERTRGGTLRSCDGWGGAFLGGGGSLAADTWQRDF